MERLWKPIVVGGVLWTVALALAVMGTVDANLPLMAWSLLVALVASLVTGWVIAVQAATIAAVQERVELETLAEIMARAAVQGAAVTKLPKHD